MQAKYYARTQGSLTEPILDTDRIFYINRAEDQSGQPYLISLFSIVITLTFILGTYGLSKTLQCIKANRRELPYIKSFYWATVIVCGTINISCSCSDFFSLWFYYGNCICSSSGSCISLDNSRRLQDQQLKVWYVLRAVYTLATGLPHLVVST